MIGAPHLGYPEPPGQVAGFVVGDDLEQVFIPGGESLDDGGEGSAGNSGARYAVAFDGRTVAGVVEGCDVEAESGACGSVVATAGDGDGDGKKKVSLLHEKREPLEVIDKEAAFPDEVREEIEEAVNKREKEEKAGSSYNSAIPFRGKAKAN